MSPEIGAIRTRRWRAVKYGQWSLFDMLRDPRQEKDLAAAHPELVTRLEDSYQKWFEEVPVAGFDPIPISIGYPEQPRVELPGHEAFLHPSKGEGIRYHGSSGWAHDWIDGWTSTDAYPYWEIEVIRAGRYDLTLEYACPESSEGTRLYIRAAEEEITTQIDRAHRGPRVTSPDRVPRKEVYERIWAEQTAGTLELPQGRTRLWVRALTRPGEEVLELKSVIVERRP